MVSFFLPSYIASLPHLISGKILIIFLASRSNSYKLNLSIYLNGDYAHSADLSPTIFDCLQRKTRIELSQLVWFLTVLQLPTWQLKLYFPENLKDICGESSLV